MQNIISVANLSKVYASGFEALKDVSLDIRRGEIFALLGPNGAGKTTLISIICGLVNPSRGGVLADGHDVVAEYKAARSRIGLVPQELTTDAFETVWATVTSSSGNVVTMRARVGPTSLSGNIAAVVTPTATATASDDDYEWTALLTVRSVGAGGTIIGACRFVGGPSQPFTNSTGVDVATSTVAVDTTVSNVIEGTIVTKSDLQIGAGASCKANIDAQRLAVDGSITGNVTARDSLELAANAKIEGDLITAKLVVTEGATFVGYCRVGPEAAKAMANGQTTARTRPASSSEPKPAARPEPVKA